MAKEGYDDYQRYQRDKVLNRKLYKRIEHASKVMVECMAEELRVGDIVLV
jgi:hypothetical protein